MSVALEFLGPLAGAVIGKRGSTLLGIQSASGAKLQLSQALAERYLPNGMPNAGFASSYRTVKVTGTTTQIHTACAAIVEVLRAETVRKGGLLDGSITVVVPNGTAHTLLEEGGAAVERIRTSSGATIAMERRGGETKDWRCVCRGTGEQTGSALRQLSEATAGREIARHEGFLSQWAFETDYSDHFETPRRAFADVLPLLDAVARQVCEEGERALKRQRANESAPPPRS